MEAIRKNVLVIQQAPDCLDVLEDTKCKVIQALDGIDGIRKILSFRPDLVITKADLPNLSALNMARILKLLKVHIPIILSGTKNTYQAEIDELPNVHAFILDSAVYFDLKKVLEGSLNIFRKLPEEPLKYKFTEHEWSNLISHTDSRRILIVEHDNLTRKANLIKLDNHTNDQIFSASDGLEAILKALLIEPDLILSAVELPTINGLTLGKVLYAVNKPYPIVYLSANDESTLKDHLQRVEGAIGYMYKGEVAKRGALVSRVEQYLNLAQTEYPGLVKRFDLGNPEYVVDEDLAL